MFFKSENKKTTNFEQKVTLNRIKQFQKETGNELGFFSIRAESRGKYSNILCVAQK
jgi:hypothetical protein